MQPPQAAMPAMLPALMHALSAAYGTGGSAECHA